MASIPGTISIGAAIAAAAAKQAAKKVYNNYVSSNKPASYSSSGSKSSSGSRQAPGYRPGVTVDMVERAKQPSIGTPDGYGDYTTIIGQDNIDKFWRDRAERRERLGDDLWHAEQFAKFGGGGGYYKGARIGQDTVTLIRNDDSEYKIDRYTWERLKGPGWYNGDTYSYSPSSGSGSSSKGKSSQSKPSYSSSQRGLTLEDEAELERLGNLWRLAQQAGATQIMEELNRRANAIRESAGLRPGIDYDPVSGALLNKSSSSKSSGGSSRGLSAADQLALDALSKAWYEATSQEMKDYYHNIANQIRERAGLTAGVDYDPVSGALLNKTTTNNTYSPLGILTPLAAMGPAGLAAAVGMTGASSLADQVVSDQSQTQYDPYNDLMAQFLALQDEYRMAQEEQSRMLQEYMNSVLGSISGMQSDMMAAIEEQARAQAEAIARQQFSNLETLAGQLTQQQESGLMSITNALEDAKMGIEDKAFQAWLAARQEMANRGLAGSGLTSDQDTRLLLQKQRDLSGAYRDANLARFDLEGRIRNSLEDIYRQMANVNEESIYADQFAKLYESALDKITRQSQTYADLFKAILPYSYVPASQFGQNLGSAIDWAKLAQQAKNDFNKLSLDQQSQILEWAKLAIQQKQVDLDYWKELGYMPDPYTGKLVPTAATTKAEREQALNEAKVRGYFIDKDGNIIPTEERRSNEANEYLRGQELAAQIQYWAEQTKLEAGKLNLSAQQFQHKMNMDQASLNQFRDQLALDQDKLQLDFIKNNINNVSRMILPYIEQKKTPPQSLLDEYNSWVQAGANLFTQAPKKNAAGIPSGLLDELLGSINNLFNF